MHNHEAEHIVVQPNAANCGLQSPLSTAIGEEAPSSRLVTTLLWSVLPVARTSTTAMKHHSEHRIAISAFPTLLHEVLLQISGKLTMRGSLVALACVCAVACAVAMSPVDSSTHEIGEGHGTHGTLLMVVDGNGYRRVAPGSVDSDGGDLGDSDGDEDSDMDMSRSPLQKADDSAYKVADTAKQLMRRVDAALNGMDVRARGRPFEVADELQGVIDAERESDFNQDISDAVMKAKHVQKRIDDGEISPLAEDVERAQKAHRREQPRPQELEGAVHQLIEQQNLVATSTHQAHHKLAQAAKLYKNHEKELETLNVAAGMMPWEQEERHDLQQARDLLKNVRDQEYTAADRGENIPH